MTKKFEGFTIIHEGVDQSGQPYVLVHYKGGDKDKLDEFDSWLKLGDLVIRHMIVRIEKNQNYLKKLIMSRL